MAGDSGGAKSAGVAYVDLAIGDTKALIKDIVKAANQAAEEAQKALSGAFDVNGGDSFKGIVDGAQDAAKAAGEAISSGLTDSVAETATAVAETLTEGMSQAGREAGEQLAFDFEEAASAVQLTLFDTDKIVTQAADAGRQAGAALADAVDESTASLGSTFGALGFSAWVDDAKNAAAQVRDSIGNALNAAMGDGESEGESSWAEFGKGLQYAVGTWTIGSMIGSMIVSGITKAFDFAKDAVIGFNSEMQSALISFGTLLGSNSKASAMLSQLKSFTLGTPFQLEDVTEDAQKLLALGISANSILPDLKGLGDAVSALGGDSADLSSVVNVFGEMQSKGQIMEVQLRELEIRGIPALKILASSYGVTTAQMQKNITAGKVMASDALPRLIAGIEQGTKSTRAMGGEMERQSKTFKGSMSNLKDGVIQFAAGAFKPVFTQVNGLTARLAGFASGGSLEKFVKPASAAVSKAIGDVARYVHELVTALMPAKPLLQAVVEDIAHLDAGKVAARILLDIARAFGEIGKNKTVAQLFGAAVTFLLAWKLSGTAIAMAQKMALAIKGVAVAMFTEDAAEDANPFLAALQVVIALGIAVYELYQHNKAFRGFVQGLGKDLSNAFHSLLPVFEMIKNAAVGAFDFIKAHLYVLLGAGPIGLAILFTVEIVKHFQALKRDVGSILSAIGGFFTALWRNVIKPVFDAISFGARLLFVVLFVWIGTPILILYHMIAPLVLALWKYVFKPAFEGIGDLAVWLWNHAIKPLGEWIGSLFTGRLPGAIFWFWHSVVEAGFRGIADIALWLWHNVFVPFGLAIEALFAAVAAVGMWLWHNALEPALQGIGAAAVWLWHVAIEPAFQGIAQIAEWLWSNILSPVFTAIGKAAKWLYDTFLKPFVDETISNLKTLGGWFSNLWTEYVDPIFGWIGKRVSTVMDDCGNAFKTGVAAIKKWWDGLVDILKAPLNFLVNTVYTNGIEEVWNYIAPKVGIGTLPDAKHFATGGVIDGPRSAGDWIPIYGTAGEGILTVDEMRALGGARGFNALRGMLGGKEKSSAVGRGHYDAGGVVSSIWDGLESAGSAVASGVGDLSKYADQVVAGGLKDVASEMLKPVTSRLGDIMPGSTQIKGLIEGVPKALIKGMLGFFGNKDQAADSAAGGSLSGNVKGWIAAAEKAAGVGSSWTTGLEEIISHESGGNPHAINLTDSNAKAGDPSRGLMQTIASTFEAYRLKSLPDDIFNPVANIVAGIRYIMSRYGSIGNVPGVKSLAAGGAYRGYATGTDGAASGWAWVGELGPELVRFAGGEQVLTHADSMRASVNGHVGGYAKGTKKKVPTLTAGEIYTIDQDAKKLESATGLTGSQIKSLANAINRLILSVKDGTAAQRQVHADNVAASKLAALQSKYAGIQSTINTAKKYANTLTSNASSFATLGSVSGFYSTQDIINGLKSNNGQLKAFTADMAKLKKLGYSNAVIEEIANMGPSDGMAYAETLASGSKSQAKQVNSLLKSISGTASSYGKSVADELYDSGANSGKGFLTGLQSQENAIKAEMAKIAKSMVDQVKKELKIHSPSRLMHEEVGAMVGAGIVTGADESLPAVQAAGVRLANAISGAPVSAPGVTAASLRGTGKTPVTVIVRNYIDGKEVIDGRIDTKIETNNAALYRMLTGGVE